MNLKIAENIKRLRSENNLTQAELAECLSVSPQAVSRWEKGQAYPDIELILKIADHFNITVDDIMGRERSDTIEFAQKFRNLRQTYYHDGAKNKDMLMQLCDMLEKLCELEPSRYANEYFTLSKNLADTTFNKKHLLKARNIGLSLFPSSDAKELNILLMNFVMHEEEKELEKWKNHIANNLYVSTWNDLLLHRYFTKSDYDKWEKTHQDIIFTHLEKVLYNIVTGAPFKRETADTYLPATTVPSEYCKLALHTLSLYSNDSFDIFFIVRFHIESRLTIAHFKEGNFKAGFDHLAVLRKYAIKLRQMIDDKTVRHGSVPLLSLVEKETKENDYNVAMEILFFENCSWVDEIRNDERFISTWQIFKSLFGEVNLEVKVQRKISCSRKFLRDVLKCAIQNLSEKIQETLLEHYELFPNNQVGLRKVEAIRDPQKHNIPKANVKDFVKQVYVKMPNRKNDLTFCVTVKDGYLRSIISSECEEPLPKYIERYEILKNLPTTRPSYEPNDWAFADGIIKKSYNNLICSVNQDILIVMLSAKENIYTAHFSTINEAVDVNLLDSNLSSLVNDMKDKDDTEIKRLVCFLCGSIDLPSYAFRDKLCRINSANLNTQILISGDVIMVKPLSATMVKGYKESFSFTNDIT